MATVETDKPSSEPTGRLRPELTQLEPEQKRAVHKQLKRRKARCGSCGKPDFTVGDALYLGFLFVSEPLDAYIVALTCENPECAAPRTGVHLKGAHFL